MIKAIDTIIGHINAKQTIKGKINNPIIEIHPEYEELAIVPTTVDQTKIGTYNKVTVAGDSDLIPENIKEGTDIFGVVGTAKLQGDPVYITDGKYLFYQGARTDIYNGLMAMCKDVISCDSMFAASGLKEINLTNFDTSKVTTMSNMFYNNTYLEKINMSNCNTTNVTNMNSMFSQCRNLLSLDLSNFNTSNTTNVNSMFSYNKFTNLDLSNFDFSKVSTCTYIFSGCTKLADLISFKNLGKGYTQKSANYSSYTLDLSQPAELTHDSLVDVITNGLYDLNLTYNVANGGTLYTQKFTLGSTNLAKLTADEIAIATAKGWTVS